MHCIVAEKEKSHLEFLCKKIFLSKKKEDGDSRECVSFLVFIAFLKSQGEGSKKGWEKEEDENLSQIPD